MKPPKRTGSKDVSTLNDKVENLSAKFSSEMEQFKQHLETTVEKPGSESEMGNDLRERFLHFQKRIEGELYQLRLEIQELNKRSQLSVEFQSSLKRKENRSKLLLHGFVFNEKSDIIDAVLDMLRGYSFNITKSDINACYKFSSKSSVKIPLVCIEFCQQWKRNEIFNNKKNLKGTKIMLSEVLTSGQLQLFSKCKTKFKRNCWTINGNIFVLHDNIKTLVNSNHVFEKICSNLTQEK